MCKLVYNTGADENFKVLSSDKLVTFWFFSLFSFSS